jgi:hypothetical protein
MLRITQMATQASRLVKLEGKLLEPWLQEVRRVCEELRLQPGPAGLDLSALTFVDAAGANLLRDLVRQGMDIHACSPFVAEILHLERT